MTNPVLTRTTPQQVASRGVLLALILVWPAQLPTMAGIVSSNAQPQIAQHFHTTQIVWFTLAFFLVTIAATPFAMKLGDIVGKRRVMLWLAGAGLVGDLISVLAPNYTMMVVGRAVGGLYGPVAALIIASVRDLFPRERVAMTYGIIGGSFGVASFISPLIAGWLIDSSGWRGGLWFIVGSTVIAFVMILLIPETPIRGRVSELDWPGGLLAGSGIALIVYGIGQIQYWGIGSAGTLLALGGGVLALVLFVLRELRTAHPIIDLGLFRRRASATVIVAPAIVLGVYFMFPGVLLFLALFPTIPHVSDGLGWTVIHFAVVGIPAGLATAAAAIGTGILLRRVNPRPVWYTSTVIMAVGLLLIGRFHADATQIILSGLVIGVAAGMGIANSNAMIVSTVSPDEQATANGLSTLLSQVAGSIAYQILFVVLTANSVVFRGTSFYQDAAFRNSFYLMAGFVVLGLLVSLAIPRIKKPAEAQEVQVAQEAQEV